MQRKKVQVAVEDDGRLLIPEEARAHVRERSSRQSFVADLRSIVAAPTNCLRRLILRRAYGLLCARNWNEKAS